MKNIFILFAATMLLMACEDKIDLSKTLKSDKVGISVDAFINNLNKPQVITLTTTQYYFDNSGFKPATGATVTVTDLENSKVFAFAEQEPGMYSSTTTGDSMLVLNHNYLLTIAYKGQTYNAYSKLNRVPTIDKITFEEIKNPFTGNIEEGKYFAEFFAKDFKGPGDRYWIRHYKNGRRNVGADNIGIGYDAGFAPNGVVDADTFILPLRQFFINEQELDDSWTEKDTIMVELYSITDETSFFLTQVVTQSQMGEGGALGALFSPPPANVPTNISNTDPNGSQAVGYFCTSAVSRATTRVPVPWVK